jgi:tripartite-type tricarboxylate transporter receptor subunit TctC
MISVGVEPMTSSSAEFNIRIKNEYEKWSTLIKRSGMTMD